MEQTKTHQAQGIIYDQNNRSFIEYCRELRDEVHLNGRVLFVKGPQLNIESFERQVAKNRCYYAYPPTGMQYLKSSLKDRGLKIDILDLNFEFLRRSIEDSSFEPSSWLKILEEYFESNNPSIVGISNLYDADAPQAIKIAEYLRDMRQKKQVVLMGGQKATYSPRGLLNESLCHFAMQRESENRIRYLFDILYNCDAHAVPEPEILFKKGNQIFETLGQQREVIINNSLVEEYEGIAVEDYCKVGTLSPFSRMAGKDKPFATILFNRGCHGGCTFCDVTDLTGRKVRSRSIDGLLEEIEFLYKERGVRHFEFLDDDLARYRDLLGQVLDEVKDKRLEISWASSNGIIASTLSDELLRKFAETGCIGFRIGVESGNEKMLRRIGKPGTIKKFLKFSQIVQNYPEMFIGDNYILGFPEEKHEGQTFHSENFGQMMDSFRFSQRMNLDWSSFAIYQQNSSVAEKKEWAEVYEDFIPTKEVAGCKLKVEGVRKGLEVFAIDTDAVPSREQLKEIWVAFNFARNYIMNKNLSEKGNPKKFISWTEAIQERYPTNPEMSFFLSIAHLLEGNKAEAENQKSLTKRNLEDSYWMERFKQFGLEEIIRDLPINVSQAEHAMKFMIEKLRRSYE